MCSVEGMIFVELYQKSIKEDIKKIQRRSVEIAAAGALSAEELRRSQEQESVNTWADEENRKILIAAGSTKVEMAGAGVDIPAIMDQWKNAVVELFGAKQSHLRKQAQVGEVRAADIVETKIARLDMLKPAGTAEWVLAAATGFAKGVQMEQAMGTWDSKVFGIELPEFPGTVDMPGSETTPATTPVEPLSTLKTQPLGPPPRSDFAMGTPRFQPFSQYDPFGQNPLDIFT